MSMYCDYDGPEFYSVVEPVARKQYECCECSVPIAAGSKHVKATGKWEGELNTFRQHMVMKGQSRDTAWFAITDGEWPAIRRAFERWLAPDNFDQHGRQHARLEDLRRLG